MQETFHRFFSQKVLPLVYDDSLSYYEVLCKMRDRLNETIDEFNTLEEAVDGCVEDVEELSQTIGGFDERIGTCEDDIDTLENRATTTESDVASLGGRMTTAENDIDGVETQLAYEGGRIDNLVGRVSTNETSISTLDASVTNLGGRVITVENNMTVVQGDIANIKPKTNPLPSSIGTAGQILTVNSGATAAEWKNVPEELPAITGQAGKFLSVNSAGTAVEWGTPAGGGLPAIGSGDAGKALVVNSAETGVEWGEALPPISSGDAGKVLAVNSSEDGAEWDNTVLLENGEVGVNDSVTGKTSITDGKVAHSLGNLDRFALTDSGLEFKDGSGNVTQTYPSAKSSTSLSSNNFNNDAVIERSGTCVIFGINGLKNLAANGSTNITGIIPTVYRPDKTYVYTLINTNASDCIKLYAYANGDLEIYNYSTATSMPNLQTSLVWFA